MRRVPRGTSTYAASILLDQFAEHVDALRLSHFVLDLLELAEVFQTREHTLAHLHVVGCGRLEAGEQLGDDVGLVEVLQLAK